MDAITMITMSTYPLTLYYRPEREKRKIWPSLRRGGAPHPGGAASHGLARGE